jgi:hypothetical protein
MRLPIAIESGLAIDLSNAQPLVFPQLSRLLHKRSFLQYHRRVAAEIGCVPCMAEH